MVAQVIAAPVMMIGQVTTAVVKTASSIAMKAGTAVAKASVSAMKTVGSALRTTATTAGKAGKGLLTSVRSSPLASRFSALTSARGGAARMASQGASRATRSAARPVAKAPRRTPVSEAIHRGVDRSRARQRMQMARKSHAADDRDRQVMRRIMQVDGPEEKQVENPFLELARVVRDKVRRTMSAAKSAAMQTPKNRLAMQVAQREHDSRTSPAMER